MLNHVYLRNICRLVGSATEVENGASDRVSPALAMVTVYGHEASSPKCTKTQRISQYVGEPTLDLELGTKDAD